MLIKAYRRLIQKFGMWWLVQFGLVSAVVLLTCIILLQLLYPIQINTSLVSDMVAERMLTSNGIGSGDANDTMDNIELANEYSPKMFKAATPLNNKPMANKEIQRIKSQLQLQCVMEMGGAPVAYINIKGNGLKKCTIGERVGDLFTVLDIAKDHIEIQVLEHKLTLTL